MADIVISEFMDEAAIRELLPGRDVLYDAKLVDRPADLIAALADARALVVRNRTQVRGALLEAAPKLRVVGRLGVGLDNIDVEACKARGIAVCPATGANDVAVAEWAITAMLVLLRGAWSATPQVIAGEWPRMTTIGREASGKTLGLVGLGGIARETATRAAALGLRICAADPLLPADHPAWKLAERVTLDELVQRSDVISLHVPLTAETRGLFDAARIAAMRRGSILLNAARGGVVDEAALCAVQDPTGTPLNVREQPNGAIYGQFRNGVKVRLIERKDHNGKAWALVERWSEDNVAGWVFDPYLKCEEDA